MRKLLELFQKLNAAHPGWIGLLALVLSGFIFTGCTSIRGEKAGIETPTRMLESTVTPSPSPSPEPRATVALKTRTPAATLMSTTVQVCPPLSGASIGDLNKAVSNPFNPPAPGSDDPHQGVDLAVQKAGMAIAGSPVQSVTAGVVAAIWRDRFPYGNAVLIETKLEDLPAGWFEQILSKEPAHQPTARSALTCPVLDKMPYPAGDEQSLYLLYAHLEDLRSPEVGQQTGCGEVIGTIGQSGNALNPHLHLEIRAGPAGARFAGLAHYTADATVEEMGNYCLWRISGTFRLIDPARLLETLQ